MSSEEITVRRCRPDEAPAVLELWEQSRSEHASTADRLEDIERLIAEPPAALLIAERSGEIVGALIAAWDGWRGNMYRLAVREDSRLSARPEDRPASAQPVTNAGAQDPTPRRT